MAGRLSAEAAFCTKIGPFRTCRDFRVESALGGKAEVGFRACQGQLLAQSGHSKHRRRPVRDALRDRNDLKVLTGCADFLPNSFAHQKPATGDTKEIEPALGSAWSSP